MALSKRDRAWHRRAGALCFNRAWVYLQKRRRTAAEDRQLLDLVHASRFHWGLVGTPRHRAIADWQVSRAYAALHEPTLSLAYARSSLELCRQHALADLLASAYEGLARAHVAAHQTAIARGYLRKAREQVEAAPVDREDRETFLGQIRDTERSIRPR
jgi:hypothetical protein